MSYGSGGKRRGSAVLQQFAGSTKEPTDEYSPSSMRRNGSLSTESDDSERSGRNDPDRSAHPFSFGCELAHGSNRIRVGGFANIPDLFQRISQRFSIPLNSIMYCTLDTPKVDMKALLGNQLSFNNIIYVHVRGQTKEVRFKKVNEKLGITVSDNKNGGVFIKAIHQGVISDLVERKKDSVTEGDLIECINGRSFISSQHVDVVNFLKKIPINGDINLRLISPQQSSVAGITKRTRHTGAFAAQTIRISDTGAQFFSALNEAQSVTLRQLANVVEEFVGIADGELAQTIFDLAGRSDTKEEFLQLLNNELASFSFSSKITEKFWWLFESYRDGQHYTSLQHRRSDDPSEYE